MTFAAATLYFFFLAFLIYFLAFFGHCSVFFFLRWQHTVNLIIIITTIAKGGGERWEGAGGEVAERWGAGGCRHVWAIVIASQLLAAHHITQLTKDRYEKCNSKIQRCTGENNRREEAGSRFWENFYLIEKAY